jgi:RNA polymerase sigma factor (sigma-70 family)
MTPILAHRPRADRGFERLYRRHVGDVYHYALAVLHNPADAEDVTQTTFMNAYRAYERGERPHTAHNWLIAIAHNVCRQRFRQAMRRPSEVALEEEDVADRLVVDEDTPTSEDIRRALRHLAFNQRAALVMRELEGRSYAEIAEVLGLSVSAVETLIFRARRALREQLEGSLTCGEAELAISKQLDGRLSRAEKSALRAHLRECAECATFARSQRAQRAALRSIGAVPLPASLASFFGGGGASVGVGVAAKTAAMFAAAALAGTASYEGTRHALENHARPHPVPATTARPASPQAAPTQVARQRLVGDLPEPSQRSQGHGKGKKLGAGKPFHGRGHAYGRRAHGVPAAPGSHGHAYGKSGKAPKPHVHDGGPPPAAPMPHLGDGLPVPGGGQPHARGHGRK